MPTYPRMLSQIVLSKTTTPEKEDQRTDTQAHYLGINVSEVMPSGADPAIFVHHLVPSSPGEAATATFDRVCSPADYNNLPAGAPGDSDIYTEFRLPTIKHYARSRAELDALWDFVSQEVQEVLKAFQRAEDDSTEYSETFTAD